MFHDGKTLVKGYAKVIEMVKSRQYAYVESKLAHQKFISDEFSIDAVCNFYLNERIITSQFGLAFPVCEQRINLQTLSNDEIVFRRIAHTTNQSTRNCTLCLNLA